MSFKEGIYTSSAWPSCPKAARGRPRQRGSPDGPRRRSRRRSSRAAAASASFFSSGPSSSPATSRRSCAGAAFCPFFYAQIYDG